jgi:organic radical activating enzyme
MSGNSSDVSITLPIVEHFYTIQGEGFHQGKAAYFIRLAGCTVGCHWCDVKESWDKNRHPYLELNSLLSAVLLTNANIVVITGGEPSEHSLDILTSLMQKNGIKTHVETAGTNPLSGFWDWVCLSPKKFKPVYSKNYEKANELKVIIYNKSDFAFAEQQAEKVPQNCLLYLQPEWSKESEMLPLIIDYVKGNPKWRISLQVHKYMNVP